MNKKDQELEGLIMLPFVLGPLGLYVFGIPGLLIALVGSLIVGYAILWAEERAAKKKLDGPVSTLVPLSENRPSTNSAARPRLRAASRPPVNAEYLLYLVLGKQETEAVTGDLDERWHKIDKKFGRHRANFWYWTQVARSLWPFGWAAVKRVSGLVALIEAWRKIKGAG